MVYIDKVTYVKNFSMGTEIDISGTFIYNGIKAFNRLTTFSDDGRIFHVLYPISVGIERLQKVLIVLLEDTSSLDNIKDLESFEKSLITHSHQDLHNRICRNFNIEFNQLQNSFLQLITRFYKNCRYGRFNFNEGHSQEKELLVNYISTSLKIDIVFDNGFFNTVNNDKIKNFFGRVVGSISSKYYEAIKEQASKLGIYTYELRYDSPAGKVFLPKFKRDSLQEGYINEQIAFKELIVYLINTKEKSGFYSFIKGIEPLDIYIALVQEYLDEICIGQVSLSLIDEVETAYQDIDDIGERLSLLELIGNRNVIFDIEDEDIEE